MIIKDNYFQNEQQQIHQEDKNLTNLNSSDYSFKLVFKEQLQYGERV
jgi:hypothetical protein